MADLPEMAGVVGEASDLEEKLAPLDINSLALLERWLQEEFGKRLAEVAKSLTLEDRRIVLTGVGRDIPGLSMMGQEGSKIFTSAAGIRKCVYLMAKAKDKDVKEAVVWSWLAGKSFDELATIVDKFSGLKDDETAGGGADENPS